MGEANYSLPENLTVPQIDQVKETLMTDLSSHNEDKLTLDGSQVQEIDASGVQLLLALYKYLINSGKELQLKNPSEKLSWALETSGANHII